MPLGKLVTPDGRTIPLALDLEEITDVAVIERSDDEIAGGAVDRRDFAERLGSEIAQRVTGTQIKTTIIPFAAHIAITALTARGEISVLLAVPTTVTAGALQAMGERIKDDAFETPWTDAALNKMGSTLISEVDARLGGVVGKLTTSAIGEGVQTVSDAVDVVGDALEWLSPDSASISTTTGARGRRMANLIAMRINQRAGRV